MPPLSAVTKRRVKLAVQIVVLALVAWFVHRAILDGWTKLQQHIAAGKWSVGQMRWAWLVVASLAYSLAQLPCGLFWRRILIGLGQRLPTAVVLRAFYIGHLGKYVPGKAMVVVMRTGMLARHGAQPAAAAVSVFYETLTMMAVGAAISAGVIAISFHQHLDWLLIAAGMVAVTGLPTFPPVFEQIVRRLRVGRGDEAAASHDVRGIGFAVFAGGWLLNAAAWALMGVSVWATLRAGGFDSSHSFPFQLTVCSAAAALSVVSGFLSFIPGGLGVRDGVLLFVLTWIYDPAAAIVTAVLVRLLWLLAELTVSLLLYRAAGSPKLQT